MKTLSRVRYEQKYWNENGRTSLRPAESVLVAPRVALINSTGDIVAVNSGWKFLAEGTGADWARIGPGANYLEVCRNAIALSSDAGPAFAGINAILKGTAPAFSMDYRCHTPSGWVSFRMIVTPIDHGDARACIAHIDIRALVVSNDQNMQLVRQFALRAINAQEQERKRISQEIHDDISNRIALLALSARQIIKEPRAASGSAPSERDPFLDQITDLSNALRDLSHSLHPPLLRYVGIKGALTTLREKFRKIHGICVNLSIPVELPRLSEEVAVCIFRITQESLLNVAKHSGADSVTVEVSYRKGFIKLSVSDSGRGFIMSEAVKKGGIGLLGMESRAVSLGGTLIVNSSPGDGTEVQLTLPLIAVVSTQCSHEEPK